MKKNILKFVIVGHIDHGKSTLIGRLLYDTNSLPDDKINEIKKASSDLGRQTEFAFLLDHFQEERDQGITIDTTQIFFSTPGRDYVIIDAPGHVEFIKNMMTGASQADAAVLIIDAKEGIKEQTKRHINILSFIGVRQLVVLVNKMDLVNYDENIYNQIRNDINGILSKTNLTAQYIIPVSALKGENIISISEKMNWHQGKYFLETIAGFQAEDMQSEELVMPIQDAYRVDNKRIFVGRVNSGEIKKGEEVIVLPNGLKTKIKSIEIFNEERVNAYTKESIGITTEDQLFIERGNIIVSKDYQPKISKYFKANIFWLASEPLLENDEITIRCSTQEMPVRVEKILNKVDSSTLEISEGDKELKYLEVGEIKFSAKHDLILSLFNENIELGRFTLVKNNNTCAGGIIIEILCKKQ